MITAQWVIPVWNTTQLIRATTNGEIEDGERHLIDVSNSSVVAALTATVVVIIAAVALASRRSKVHRMLGIEILILFVLAIAVFWASRD